MSPARRRDAVAYLCRRHRVSQRHACRLVGQHRSTQRYVGVPGDFETRLVKEMHAFATANPRYGYRRVHALLVSECWAVNVKRVERLWRLEGLRVPPRRQKRWGNNASGVDENSAWALPALRPRHIWSYDFVAARTRDGGPLRILNVVDEFTRECMGVLVARNIGARAILKFLEGLFARHGAPSIIRSDNGREFIAKELVDWLAEQGVIAAFVAKASPQQNCFVERFNGSMRDELLNGEEFHSVTEARVVIGEWVETYNTARPHRGLRMQTPAKFAAAHAAASANNDTREGGR